MYDKTLINIFPVTGFRVQYQCQTVILKLHSGWTIALILSNMLYWTWPIWQCCIYIAAVSVSFRVAAKGGLWGELLFSRRNCLFFHRKLYLLPLLVLWWLWSHLPLLHLMLRGSTQWWCTGRFWSCCTQHECQSIFNHSLINNLIFE